ncbi:hypothetical protein GCM10009847_18150 [Leucobacter tardus]
MQASAGSAAALLLLTSCSVTGPTNEHFDRAQTVDDQLSHEALTTLEIVDPDSTRYLIADKGTRFYAAHPSSDEGVCLVMVPEAGDGTDASAACSLAEPVTVRDGNTQYSLTRMADADQGWEEIAPHLWKHSRLAESRLVPWSPAADAGKSKYV